LIYIIIIVISIYPTNSYYFHQLKLINTLIMSRNNRVIVLFDVDGTLTPAREEASLEMKQFLQKLKSKVVVGIVGGSDLPKQQEQMGANVINEVDYSFSENGLVAYKDGQLIGKQAINTYLGEENIKTLVNFVLHYIADLDIPVKRGTFIEFRQGMLNVSPIGRNCNREERNAYEEFDLVNFIKATIYLSIIKYLEKRCS